MRYCQTYTDSTAIDVAANGGFGGNYFGIHYVNGNGPTFTNNATSGSGSFMWTALSNNDSTNGTVQMAGSGSVVLLDPLIMNKGATVAGVQGPSYKSTSSVKSGIFGGHYMSSGTGGSTVMTIPAVDYPLHGWIDNAGATDIFGISGSLRWVDPDGPTVRNLLGISTAGGDSLSISNADSVLYDGVRDRGAQ
jgi:hypothetical protein